MQLSAKYGAVFELMQEVFADKQPADNIISNYFRGRRYIGSSDRRFISEKIWDVVRKRARLSFDAGSLDCRKMLIIYLKNEPLDDVFCGGKYGLPELEDDEKKWLHNLDEKPYPENVEVECPQWIFDKIGDKELLASLNNIAAADFRINASSREDVIAKLALEGLEFCKTPYSPFGIRSNQRLNINNCVAFQEGVIDVQDEASQVACLLADVKPHHRVIDFCAGAGGKALTIAYILKGLGLVEVYDIDKHRLENIKPRLERLGVKNIKAVSDVNGLYDRFIIDAPCSGSGVWRRTPDAKFRLSPEKINELNKLQAEILQKAVSHVALNGRIVYFTCSIFEDENQKMIEEFLLKNKNFSKISVKEVWEAKIEQPYPAKNDAYLNMSPLKTNTDGFFVAILQKNA